MKTDDLKTEMVKILMTATFLPKEELEFLEGIVWRNDGQAGHEQCLNAIKAISDYNKEEKDLDIIDKFIKQKNIASLVWATKTQFYKQIRVMVAVAMRKKHPKVDIPNLFGLIAPQAIRLDVQACYGLGYEEARNYFVKLALDNPAYTHIFYVDDDILLPLDALPRLLGYQVPIVGAIYTKRNPTLETVVSSPIAHSKKYVYENTMIEPKQGDYSLVPAGCLGLGATLIDVDVFKKIPSPHFKFIFEQNADGSRGRVLVGEDSAFIQKATQYGIKSYVVPGVCAVHVDLKTGQHYGPEWLVDPTSRKLKKEFEEHYTKFAVAPQECYAQDVCDTFNYLRPVGQ